MQRWLFFQIFFRSSFIFQKRGAPGGLTGNPLLFCSQTPPAARKCSSGDLTALIVSDLSNRPQCLIFEPNTQFSYSETFRIPKNRVITKQ